MRRRLLAVAAVLSSFAVAGAQGSPHLLRAPSLSETEVAFRYADDVWLVSRNGGGARRLTSTANVNDGPYFSPDGRTVAYSTREAGNVDIFTVPVTGGVPHRITFHPAGNYLAGWTPDGKDLLMVSMQEAVRTYLKMYRLHADGSGLAEALPLPSASDGSMSPDGTHLAYTPWLQWQANSWKRYRGGQTEPIWVVDLKTLDRVKVPRENSNDTHPVWMGDAMYFLSDRNGPVSLFRYDVGSKTVKQVVENKGLDLRTLSGHNGTLAYEQFGVVHLLDTSSGKDSVLNVQLDGDLPALVPHLAKVVPDEVQNVGISPTGVRGVFEAHGEIFTVPADKGTCAT